MKDVKWRNWSMMRKCTSKRSRNGYVRWIKRRLQSHLTCMVRESRESSPDQARIENRNLGDNGKQQQKDGEPKRHDSKPTTEETKLLTDGEYREWLINENSSPCEECGRRMTGRTIGRRTTTTE